MQNGRRKRAIGHFFLERKWAADFFCLRKVTLYTHSTFLAKKKKILLMKESLSLSSLYALILRHINAYPKNKYISNLPI